MSWRWGDGSGPSSSRRLIFHREPVPIPHGPFQGMGGQTEAVSMSACGRVLTLIGIQCIFSWIMTAQAKTSLWLWKVFLGSLGRNLRVAHGSSSFLGLSHWTHGLPCDKYPSWPPLLPFPLLPSTLPKSPLARIATWVASEENDFVCFLRADQAEAHRRHTDDLNEYVWLSPYP